MVSKKNVGKEDTKNLLTGYVTCKWLIIRYFYFTYLFYEFN